MATNNGNVIKMPDIETTGFKPNPKGIGHAYFENMVKNKNKIVQTDAKTGESDTYDRLLSKCVRTAIHLKKAGVTKDDTISSCSSYAHLHGCVPFIAATFVGAKFSGLDPRLPLPFIVQALKTITPKFIFIEEKYGKLIEDAVKETNLNTNFIVFDKYKHYLYFEDIIKPTHEEKGFTPIECMNLNETVVIYFVILTGLEGICINHYSIMAQAYLFCGMKKSTLNVIMGLATFNYTISATIFLSSAIFFGDSLLLVDEFNEKSIWKLIHRYKVNFLFATTSQATMMAKSFPKNITLDSFKELCLGGSELIAETIDLLRKLIPQTRIIQCYGKTEAGGVIISFNSEEPEVLQHSIRKPTSAGVPLHGFWYKVVDLNTGKLLGPKQEGELYVKSKCIMNICSDQKLVSYITQDHWLKTGDILYYDEDLCFYVVDPIKEVYKYKDWYIAPTLIENVIKLHTAVNEVAVVGIPHAKDSSHSFALVVLKKDAKNVKPRDIVSFIEETMEKKYHLVGGCKFVDKLPHTLAGKVDRRLILKMIGEAKL